MRLSRNSRATPAQFTRNSRTIPAQAIPAQFPHNSRAMPARCTHYSRAMPARSPRTARTLPTQVPHASRTVQIPAHFPHISRTVPRKCINIACCVLYNRGVCHATICGSVSSASSSHCPPIGMHYVRLPVSPVCHVQCVRASWRMMCPPALAHQSVSRYLSLSHVLLWPHICGLRRIWIQTCRL